MYYETVSILKYNSFKKFENSIFIFIIFDVWLASISIYQNYKKDSQSYLSSAYFKYVIICFKIDIKNPDFYDISREFAVAGGIAVLNFTFHSPHELISIKWQHNNESIMLHHAAYVDQSLGRHRSTIDTSMRYIMLIITNAKYKDSGNYTCTMFFYAGLPINKVWILQVQG